VNPRPLAPLFVSPRQLLDKARRDLERLENATFAGNEIACRDAMIDACCSVYHANYWIKVMHARCADLAEQHAHGSKWILLCRDICHASKHVGLRLDREPHVTSPQAADRVDRTIGDSVGPYADLPVLKVFSKRSRDHHYASVVIENAIADWEHFLSAHQIP